MINLTVQPKQSEKLAGRGPSRLLLVPACLLLAGASSFGQSATGLVTNYVSSNYSLGQITVGAQVFTTVGLGVAYDASLSASQFVLGSQLTALATAAFAAYPTPTDPPEAIGVSVAQAVMAQYPQINGVSLELDQVVIPAGYPTSGTITENTILVELGTLTSTGDTAAKASRARKAGRRAPAAPATTAPPQQQK
jgi:hypothetical protein